MQFGKSGTIRFSITPLAGVRGQRGRRTLPAFQTTGRSRENEAASRKKRKGTIRFTHASRSPAVGVARSF
jgi:hypothetical protein